MDIVNDLWRAAGEILEMFCGAAFGSVRFAVPAAVGCVVLIVSFNLVGRAFGVANRGLFRMTVGAVLAVFTALLTASAVRVWGFPLVGHVAVRIVLQVALPVIVLAGVAVPLMRWVFHASYVGVLVMTLVGLALATGAMALTASVLDAVSEGDRQSQQIRRRATDTERMLNR